MLDSQELVHAVLNDFRTAPIDSTWHALFALLEKASQDSTQICQADIDQANRAGWSDEALYDALTVHSLFQFYNTWIDTTGVSPMSPKDYEQLGLRLATNGYFHAHDTSQD